MSAPKGAKRLLIILAAVAAVAGAAIGIYFSATPGDSGPAAQRSAGRALIGGPFTLIDQNGETFSDDDLKGHISVIYFGFTFCPDICPTELQQISTAIDMLEANGADISDLQPIFITIDPQRDTPDRLQDYISFFHPKFIALTGSSEAIDKAARAYRVYHAKVADESTTGGYTMDHTSIVYVMGREADYLAHFAHGTPPEEMAARLERHL